MYQYMCILSLQRINWLSSHNNKKNPLQVYETIWVIYFSYGKCESTWFFQRGILNISNKNQQINKSKWTSWKSKLVKLWPKTKLNWIKSCMFLVVEIFGARQYLEKNNSFNIICNKTLNVFDHCIMSFETKIIFTHLFNCFKTIFVT